MLRAKNSSQMKTEVNTLTRFMPDLFMYIYICNGDAFH